MIFFTPSICIYKYISPFVFPPIKTNRFQKTTSFPPHLTLPYAHHTFPYAGCFEVSQLTRRLRRLRFSMKPSWRLHFGLRGLRGWVGPLHVHTFPFMSTSSPSWAHLPPHGHIFPFMGTSSPSCAHLPLHGHIFPFMGTSSPSWAHLPLHGHIFPFLKRGLRFIQ